MQATQAWGNMAQYMRDAITAQGAGPEQHFGRANQHPWTQAASSFLAAQKQPKLSYAKQMKGMFAGIQQQKTQQSQNTHPWAALANLVNPPQRNTTTASVVSPGQTQVIRPSAQAARRQGPSAETDTSLLTRQMGPEDVALGMSSLLGG